LLYGIILTVNCEKKSLSQSSLTLCPKPKKEKFLRRILGSEQNEWEEALKPKSWGDICKITLYTPNHANKLGLTNLTKNNQRVERCSAKDPSSSAWLWWHHFQASHPFTKTRIIEVNKTGFQLCPLF